MTVMDGQRQLGPPSHLNPLSYPVRGPGLNSNDLNSYRHPIPQHMQNGGPSRLNNPNNMTVGGAPGNQTAMTLQNPNTLQPGTVYLIRSPSGELQLVRLAPNVGPPQMGPGNVQRPGMLNQQMGSNIRFPAPGTIGGPQSQPQQQPPSGLPQLSGLQPQNNLSGPPQMGPQTVGPNPLITGMSHPPIHAGVPQMGMRPQMATNPGMPMLPGGGGQGSSGQANQVPLSYTPEDSLMKAKQFFMALLSMSRGQNPTMYPTARDLLQQLVDARINPDQFARRLQEELKSTPQPVLAPLLRSCLGPLRRNLASGEIVIDGIQAPPPAALALTDPDVTLPVAEPQSPSTSVSSASDRSSTKTSKSQKSGKSGSSGGGSSQHPVFDQIPQLHTHTPKTEKTKPGKGVIAAPEKKMTAKQKRQKEGQEKRASIDHGAAHDPASKDQKESKADDDELNDVAAMAGVNLSDESARLSSAELVGTQTRSVDDEALLPAESVRRRVINAVRGLVSEDIPLDVLTIISHAVEARIRNCCERLDVIAEHRQESVRGHVHYKQTQDIRGQLQFLAELDRVEKRKREEEEKEALSKAIKSRNRPEDPERMKLKLKAKEIQRAEEDNLRTSQANQAAMAELMGSRAKKPRLGPETSATHVPHGPGPASGSLGGSGISKAAPASQPYRPKVKRAALRDVVFMMETSGKMSKSPLLYQILQQLK